MQLYKYLLQYLQKRFGTTTRLIASFAFLLQLLLYSGVVLYAPALALEATTGLSTTASVIGLGLICTFYSTIGGIKAVLITDVVQGVLMLTAVVTVIATAAVATGGLDRIWQIAGEGSRLEFDKYLSDDIKVPQKMSLYFLLNRSYCISIQIFIIGYISLWEYISYFT